MRIVGERHDTIADAHSHMLLHICQVSVLSIVSSHPPNYLFTSTVAVTPARVLAVKLVYLSLSCLLVSLV